MFSQFSPTLRMSTAALTLIVLLFITGGGDSSSVHEQIAAPPSSSGKPSFKGGFSLPIIHRNDPRSPLRDPTVTTFDLFKEEIQLSSSPMLPSNDALASEKMLAPVHFRRGLYLVPLRIGGSLDRISSRYLMFDTGTDLSWTQCFPYYAHGHYPPYNPSKSSSFRSVFCDDPLCEHSSGLRCSGLATRECMFYRGYDDGISKAMGYLVSDIFHFSYEGNYDYHFEPRVVFGCATSESSTFVREYNTGILALGISSLSFQAQVGVDRFSYCVPATARPEDGDQALTYLRFGSQAQLSGKRIPFRKFKDHQYIVYLNRVTYQHGNRLTQQQLVPIFPGDEANAKSKAKMLVDLGTMGLWLADYLFYPLLKKIEAGISLTRVLFDDNPNAYCYIGDMADVEQVSVTLGFVGGAEMLLSGYSLFFEYNGNMICLGATLHNSTVLGIYAQRNTNMGFDLIKGEIAIDQAGCSL